MTSGDIDNKSKGSSSTEAEAFDAPDSIPAEDAAGASSAGDSGKMKMVLSILRQFIGVKDMATVRFSLPAQLMEPIPNLEYWNYLDRPDYFVCIGDSEDPLERMLGLLRWYLTKDLKLINGKICKPYNSVLGEFFRCNWNVDRVPTSSLSTSMLEPTQAEAQTPVATKSSRFKMSRNKSTATQAPLAPPISQSTPSTRPASPTNSIKSGKSTIAVDDFVPLEKPLRIAFLCEQTSHHPPVSAYIYSCPEKRIEAYGMDQIAAKFTGTTIKVQSGEQNAGIFVNLQDRREEYQCSHPTASVCGFLRGSLYASVQDTAVVSCAKTGLKAIIAYKDEPWIGKPKYALEGIIFRYNPTSASRTESIRDIPEDAIVARLEGTWKGKIYISGGKSSAKHVLIDVTDMPTIKKTVPALSAQKPNESRVVWDPVTQAILSKKFELATRYKTEIEDKQRKLAKDRTENKEDFTPEFFEVHEDGRPTLTAAGLKTLKGQHDQSWSL